MIQDISPKKLYNQYTPREPEPADFICIFQQGLVYAKAEGIVKLPTYAELLAYCETRGLTIEEEQEGAAKGTAAHSIYLGSGKVELQYAFSIEETAYYLCDFTAIWMEGYGFHRLFSVRAMKPVETVLAIATAYHLSVWYSQNCYCGKCGGLLLHDDSQRMLACPNCGNMVFPKLAPAVIVAVTHGDRILVTKYAGREYKRYALIAGFCEIGETAEETVAREVMEEVGLEVTNITYYKSQPWGFDSNLLLGYFCELKKETPIQMDEAELAVAEWISYKDIPEDHEGLSLTMDMMQEFRRRNEI